MKATLLGIKTDRARTERGGTHQFASLLGTVAGIARLGWGGWRNVCTRLSFLIPLSVWPVFAWIVSQNTYRWGRHSSSPLEAVFDQAVYAIAATSGAGLLLILSGGRSWAIRGGWLVFELMNLMILRSYLESNFSPL